MSGEEAPFYKHPRAFGEGRIETREVTVEWSREGLEVRAPHLAQELFFAPDTLTGVQLSRTHHSESEGDRTRPCAHLEIRTTKGIRVRISAWAPADEIEALPEQQRLGARVEFAVMTELMGALSSWEVHVARWDEQQAREQEPNPLGAPEFLESPVIWPPELRPPPRPPTVWHARHRMAVTGLAFDRDAAQLFSTSWDGALKAWSLQTGQPVDFNAALPPLRGLVAASPVDERAVTWVGRDEVLMLRDEHGKRELTIDPALHIRALAFSPDGTHIVAVCRSHVVIISVESGESVTTEAVEAEAWSVCFTAHDRALLGGRDGRITPLTLSSDAEVEQEQEFTVGEGRITGLSFDAAHGVLAVLWSGRSLTLYKPEGEEVVAKMSKPPPTALGYTPRGTLITGHQNGAVLVWGDEGHTVIAQLPVRVRAVCSSSDGYWIAAGDDAGNVVLWDVVRKRRYRA